MYDDVYFSQFIKLQTLKTFLVLESTQSSPLFIFKSLLNTKIKGSRVPSGFKRESFLLSVLIEDMQFIHSLITVQTQSVL